MPPKIRGMANMSSVTQGINFLLGWAYLSILNVSTGQSNSIHYVEGRVCCIQERVCIGRELGWWEEANNAQRPCSTAERLDVFLGCKSQACFLGAYHVLPVCDGTGSLLEYRVQFLRACRKLRLITVGKPVLLLDFSFLNKKLCMLASGEVDELYFANIYRGKKKYKTLEFSRRRCNEIE